VSDLEFADAVLVLDVEPVDDAPILDLRLRKGVRRHGMRLAVAGGRPSALDATATASARFAPGAGEAFLAAVTAAVDEARAEDVASLAASAGSDVDVVRAVAKLLSGAGEDVVILYGERLVSGPRGAHAARGLLNLAGKLKLTGGRAGAGLLAVPNGTNGRGLAEAGVLPNAAPGLG
jgi:NADH-quinone oxidoreductase subunit G